MNPCKIAFIIPAYNEEEGIAHTLCMIPRADLERLSYDCEIIVVNNNSSDKTKAIALSHGARVIDEAQQGYGYAYKSGILATDADIIITADADGTYPLDTVVTLLEYFQSHSLDFLTTNRFRSDFITLKTMPFVNRIGNGFLSFLVNALFNISLKDSQSGMWIFKRSLYAKARIRSNQMAFSQELKIEFIYNLRCVWKEIDINYNSRLGEKKLRVLRHGLDNALQLFNQRFRK